MNDRDDTPNHLTALILFISTVAAIVIGTFYTVKHFIKTRRKLK